MLRTTLTSTKLKKQTAQLYEKILYNTFWNLQRKINSDSVTFILTERSVIIYEAS